MPEGQEPAQTPGAATPAQGIQTVTASTTTPTAEQAEIARLRALLAHYGPDGLEVDNELAHVVQLPDGNLSYRPAVAAPATTEPAATQEPAPAAQPTQPAQPAHKPPPLPPHVAPAPKQVEYTADGIRGMAMKDFNENQNAIFDALAKAG